MAKYGENGHLAIGPCSTECRVHNGEGQYTVRCTVDKDSTECTVHRGEAIAARGNYHQAADRAPHQPSGDHHDDFDHRDDYDHLDHFDHCVNFDHCDDFDHHDDFDGVRRI